MVRAEWVGPHHSGVRSLPYFALNVMKIHKIHLDRHAGLRPQWQSALQGARGLEKVNRNAKAIGPTVLALEFSATVIMLSRLGGG